MEKKSKKIWIIGGLVLCLVAVIGITFAFFSTGGMQETANTFTSGCLNIELTDASASINLTNTYPISDVEGVDSTSYDFTIRNTCDTSTNYSINLESLNQVENSLNADYIKVSLSSDTFDNVISKLSDNTSTTPEIDGAYESYTLYTGSLGANETKTYHLKLWIDYDATVEQAANKTYSSKINVIANPETSVIDTLEAKFTLDDKTLTSSLSSNVTSATYCTTTTNICEPTTPATITNNTYTVELEGNNSNQMVCTKLNGTSKVICSNGLDIKLSAKDYILAFEGGTDAVEAKGTPDFSQMATTDEGMYAAEDDYGTSYYYRGAVADNWVQFDGYYWRIIRINGNGSIRMIYSGNSETGPVTTGEGTQIGTSAFNSSYNNNAYVGYMYGNVNASDYAGTHANTNSSTIKGILDTWYNNNLATNYGEYIDGNAGFCGDRRVSSSGTGIGTSTTDYQPYTRMSNSSPSLSCEKADIYTVDEFEHGNGALTYPIGLISADEAMFAGIPNWIDGNSNTYLYTGQTYWTISPSGFLGGSYGVAGTVRVNSSGGFDGWLVYTANGIRPVINIRADVELTGSGTTSAPFKIVGAS